MITFKLVCKKQGAWHIHHCYALCDAGTNVIDKPDKSIPVLVDGPQSKATGELVMYNQNNDERIYGSDICTKCFKRFKAVFTSLPLDDPHLNRGY